MKILSFACIIALSTMAFSIKEVEDVEFICMKTHKASNTCHFNFKVDGANYRFVDIGCKYAKKQKEVIDKVHEGTLSLAKEWKIACPEPKSDKKEGL
jgi:hypothetical protein